MMNRAVLLCAFVASLSFAQTPQPDPQDLKTLVAPIALYPDMLLSQVLAASTYPAEITEARNWMRQNPGLRGRQLIEAAKQQNWDPSVQALVAFPEAMDLLTRDIQWTTDLGNAFLSQQAAVMDAIQQLRASARANGRLNDTPQQRVTYEQENGQNAIVIQPTDPQTVYAPIYNPVYVWGPPMVGYYPPLGYPAPGYGVGFAVGTFLGGLFSGLLSFGGWGWGLSWLSHGLFLNGLFFNHFGFHGYSGPGYGHVAWAHNASHRLGVPYGGHYAAGGHNGPHFAGGARTSGGNGGRTYNSPRPGNSYAGSGYHNTNRQAEAYRALSAGSARSGASHSSAPTYRGESANRGAVSHGWSAPSSNYRATARNSGGHSSAPHYKAPKSSGHSGGGHSSGHGHSGGGGGHSHGGSHKK